MLATYVQRYDTNHFIFDPVQERETSWNFTGCHVPHLMIVLIPYINLLNLSWIIKCQFLRNMEPSGASIAVWHCHGFRSLGRKELVCFPAGTQRWDNAESTSMPLHLQLCYSKQLFHARLWNSQNYSRRPRAIVYRAVHGTKGSSFDYSTKTAMK